MDKINVLWIEDNPLQEALYVSDLIKRDNELEKIFNKDLHAFQIPTIHFIAKELKEYHKYFNLQVLQHPVEIKDFITMCLQLEDAKGKKAFMELEKVLPEVIAFDYHFSERITINQPEGCLSYNPKIKIIREFINPNFRFIEKFKELFKNKYFLLEKSESENYSQIHFLKAISKLKPNDELKKQDKDSLSDDDFGLFAAIEIQRIFREHPTVAIPATFNKNEIEKLSIHGKFFEWLNEYDYSINFARQERGNKKWDSVLKDAAKALQVKIEAYSKLGKIIFDLAEILKIASGEISEKESERVLTVHSSYGKKQLPLDGLFINVPKENRNSEIKVWIEKIFHFVFINSSSTISLDVIDQAKKYADTLWGAYQDKRFWDRVNFSRLHKLIEEEVFLSEEEKEKYNQYLSGEIEGFKVRVNRRGRNGSYEYLDAIELKGFIKKSTTRYTKTDKLILSWTVLFVVLKIYKVRMDYLKKNKKVDAILPSENEILTILFPLASNPIIMPIHGTHDKTSKDYINEHFILNEKSSKPFDDLMIADENFFDKSTKYLLRWYAESINLTEIEHFPKWLK